MILTQKYHNLVKRVMVLTVAILAFEFCFPHQLQAGEIVNAGGPVLLAYMDVDRADLNPPKETMTALPAKPKMTRWVTTTAYSSTVDQCDDTPFITANGKWVYDGLVAANFLPFGTKIKIPDIYGDKIFTVNDRMNQKYNSRVDIWMTTREAAIQFGAQYVKIEIY